MGRDPQRAVPILIPARRVLTFKPSQVLKNILTGCLPSDCLNVSATYHPRGQLLLQDELLDLA
jgi:hypothetical protein